jgi:hypothetical protein
MSEIDVAIASRKFAKTCVEKKRRDRINRCLEELKDLMSQTDDKARYQKLEKAEILEMAVNYMRSLRRTHEQSPDTNQAKNYYNLAYTQCLNEFRQFLNSCPSVHDEFKVKCLNHLNKRYTELSQQRYAPYQPTNLTQTCYSPQQQQHQQQQQIPLNVYQNIKLEGFNQDENKLIYQQSKFGGSCSSLDSYNMRASSPSEDSNSQSSVCSSPNIAKNSSCSSLNFSNIEIDSKVWRPW